MLAGLTPLAGGWSGETFLAEAAGERTVVRIFAGPRHTEHAAQVQAAVLELVRGLVPVPEVVEVRRGEPELGTPAVLVTSFVEGLRGDELLPALDDAGLERVGRQVGGIAASLAGMPTLRAGRLADSDLRIEPFPAELDDLELFLDSHPPLGWSPVQVAALAPLCRHAQALLDSVPRTCLVHSDLNPKNLLLDPDGLRVTAVLDWEYAHSGHPASDVGNLLRFDRRPAYVRGVLAAWSERHGWPEQEVLDLARAADLRALVELASRADENPVAAAAEQRLRAIVAAGSLHADEH